MKEIIAIIRPKMVSKTKEELECMGINSLTVIPVQGHGKQRGIMGEVDIEYRPHIAEMGQDGGMKYVPKRYVSIVVPDDAVDAATRTIVEVSRTGQVGDGRIFICPVEDALRVRTGETGEHAIL